MPLAAAIGVARFEGHIYPLDRLGAWALLDIGMLAAIIAVTWVAKRKLFPGLGMLSARKDPAGNFIL